MTDCHVIVANESNIFVWQYRAQVAKSNETINIAMNSALRTKEEVEYLFHIDETNIKPYKGGGFKITESTDQICAIYAYGDTLFVAREYGTVYQYLVLPTVSLTAKFVLKCRPQMLACSCDAKKLSVIDINGVFSLYKLTNTNTEVARKKKLPVVEAESMNVDRKEVWDMKWADDNPDLFAIMEKTKMYTFRGVTPEEPKLSSACKSRTCI
jgi:WD repeat-containing protein 35